LDASIEFTSGNLVIPISVCITLHTFHKEIAEHAVFRFLERLSSLVASCCVENILILPVQLWAWKMSKPQFKRWNFDS
jgi:hypothetical protein